MCIRDRPRRLRRRPRLPSRAPEPPSPSSDLGPRTRFNSVRGERFTRHQSSKDSGTDQLVCPAVLVFLTISWCLAVQKQTLSARVYRESHRRRLYPGPDPECSLASPFTREPAASLLVAGLPVAWKPAP